MKRNRIKKAVLICLLSAVLTPGLLYLYLTYSHSYSRSDATNKIVISMSDEKPNKSSGREMRIVRILLNGKELDLNEYQNDDWIWHPEWGYIFYQQGDNCLEITHTEPINSFYMEYVKQEGSGICTLDFGNQKVDLRMYRSSWKNEVLSVNFWKVSRICLAGLEIFFLLILVIFAVLKLIECIRKSEEIVGEVSCNLAMFNFAKGVAMIGVIFVHSVEDVGSLVLVNMDISSLTFGMVSLIFSYGLMPMFFIISGYGFRKGKITTVSFTQLKYLAIPYLKIFVLVVAVVIIRCFADTSYTITNVKTALIPFIVLSAHDGAAFGNEIGNIGPMWFSVSLCFAWIILNIIIVNGKRWVEYSGVLLCVLVSFLLSKFDIYFFCLTQTFAVVPMLYVGYKAKVNKIWVKEKGKDVATYIALAVICFFMMILNGFPFNITVNNWGGNQIIGLLTSVISGFLLVRLCLAINQKIKGKAQLIKKIGYESLHVFYMHIFEYLAIPWRDIFADFRVPDILKILLIFFLRSGVIAIMCYMVKKIKKVKRHIRTA